MFHSRGSHTLNTAARRVANGLLVLALAGLLAASFGRPAPVRAARQSAPAPATAASLAPLLTPDGALKPGLRGSFDARGYRMKFGARGEPRFAAAAAFCGDNWADNFAVPGPNDYVFALAVIGSDIYVGGQFTAVNSLANTRGIAKWDGTSWSAVGSGMNNDVYTLAVIGTDLYAAGPFTNAGGVAANRIAKWNGSTWAALGSGLNDSVNALAVIGTNLFAGGFFTTADGNPAARIAKWDTVNASWTGLGGGLSNAAFALAARGADLYAGGQFLQADGITVDCVAKWNTVNANWTGLGGGVSGGPVYALALDATNLYAGGDFNTAGGAAISRVAKWNGTSWSALGSGMDDSVYALATFGTDLYAGGLFSTAGGNAASYIAKWDGAAWSALGDGMDGDVGVLLAQGTSLYAGGSFTTAGCHAVDRFAKYDLTCNSLANGNWSASATWSCGHAPQAADAVVIQAGHSITLDANAAVASFIVNAGGTLTVSGGTRTVSNHITMNGALVLNSDLNMTNKTLTLGSSATSSGTADVLGNVSRTGLANGTTYFFGNADNQITFNSGTPPTAFALNLAKTAPSGLSNAIARSYTLTPTGGSGYSATVRLRYLQSEVGALAESGFSLHRYNGTSWVTQTNAMGSPDTTNNWVESTGVTAFSPWGIGVNAPLAVKLVDFTAQAGKRGVALHWRTGYEADNLGFNLYREVSGKRVKLNPSLIAGTSLTAEQVVLSAGNSYAWQDARGTAGASYWLEELDLKGTSTWHGPLTASGDALNLTVELPETAQAKLLAELNDDAPATPQREWAEASEGQSDEATGRWGDGATGRVATPQALLAAEPWTLPSRDAVKLAVRQTGWYRVTQAELAATGFNINVNPQLLQLFADGAEVPMKVNGKGAFGFESLEFYGRGLDLPATDTRVYWLTASNASAKRLETISPKAPDKFNTTGFRSTVERKDRLIYFSGLLNGDAENWFGPVIAPAGAAQKLTTRFLDRTAAATLELTLQGVTEQAHAVSLQVNGRDLSTFNFKGKEHPTQRFNVPGDWLLDGENEIKLLAVAGASDISLVDCVRLSYTRAYRAENDTLNFSLGAGQSAWIGGFSTPNLRVLQLNNQAGNGGAEREIAVKAQLVNGSYGFALTGDGAAYLALADQRLERVAALTRNLPSDWRAANNAADFVILTHRDFWAGANRLANARRAGDMRVAVVDVEDAYDEFAFGARTPQALKDLLTHAGKTWQRKPAYALLIGDATYDPRNYLGAGNFDFVPTKLGATIYFETALDNWFADANNDSLPELALGRLPVRSAAQADAVINKILAFKPATAPRPALFASDRTVEGYDFKALSVQLAGLLPADWPKQHINRNDAAPDEVRNRIVQSINSQSPLVVNWFGHGSTQVWTGDGLLRAQDAAALTNASAGLFVMATCLNGFFTDPQQVSLGEAALTNPAGGAFAVISSSALNEPNPQLVFAQTLYRSLFNGLTLGQAMTAARLAAGDRDVRNSYVLFGDPTLQLRGRK